MEKSSEAPLKSVRRRALDRQTIAPIQLSGLRWYSKFVCASTLFLIFAGGMVTSTGSGLAVPDWPLSYGSLFPPMVGGIFYEHGHRLIASFVGVLMVILTVWIARKEQRSWVRKLTFVAMGTVVCQGLLGGLTVKLMLPMAVSVTHGIIAQSFFVLTVIIAYSQSREYLFHTGEGEIQHSRLWKLSLGFALAVYVQLILGALMRHSGSGLAIPDFPKMGGSWAPPFSEQALRAINDRLWEMDLDLVTANQVLIHFLHRTGAVLVSILGISLVMMALKTRFNTIRSAGYLMGAFLVIQVTLGISTVLTKKAPVITSFHVVTGAALLGIATLCTLRAIPWSSLIRNPREKAGVPS